MLSVLSEFIPQIPEVEVDGIFGPATRTAVLAAQGWFGLPQTGVVDEDTWDDLYDQFAGIENTSLRSEVTFPGTPGTTLRQFPGDGLRPGNQDPVRQEVVR
jgi:peptidoglycan hydrolase-like protein with peptidoglycan-binding domain